MLLDTKPTIKPAYKTYKQLRIRKRIYMGLMWVRNALLSGEIKAKEFDMSEWWMDFDCKTPSCIGGWTEFHVNQAVDGESGCGSVDQIDPEHTTRALDLLFFPDSDAPIYDGKNPYSANRKQAAMAIDNYLNGSKNPWEGVMGA